MSIFKSRTILTIIIMFTLTGLQSLQHVMPADAFILLQGFLTLLAGYFKVNPSQKY